MDSYEVHDIYQYILELMRLLYSRILAPDTYFVLICVNIFALVIILVGIFFYFTSLRRSQATKQKHFKSCEVQVQESVKLKSKHTKSDSDRIKKKELTVKVKRNSQSDKSELYNETNGTNDDDKYMAQKLESESCAAPRNLTISEILVFLKSTKLNNEQTKQIFDVIFQKDAQLLSSEMINECPQCMMKDQATMTGALDCKHNKLQNVPEAEYNSQQMQELKPVSKSDELNVSKKHNEFKASLTLMEQCVNKIKKTYEMEVQSWQLKKAKLLQKLEHVEGCQKEKELSYKLLSYKLEKINSFCHSEIDDQSDLQERHEDLQTKYNASESSRQKLQIEFDQWKENQANVVENLKMKIIQLKQSNVKYIEKYEKLRNECKFKDVPSKDIEKQNPYDVENIQDIQYSMSQIKKGKRTLCCMFPDIKVNDELDDSEWFIQFGEKVLNKINKIKEDVDTKIKDDVKSLDIQLINMGGKVEDVIQEKKQLESQVIRQKAIILETDSLIGDIRQMINTNENLRVEKLLFLEKTLLEVVEMCKINYEEHINQQVISRIIQFDELLLMHLNSALNEAESLKGVSEVFISKLPVSIQHTPRTVHPEGQLSTNHNGFMHSTSFMSRPEGEKVLYNQNEVDPSPKSEKRKKNKKKRQDKK